MLSKLSRVRPWAARVGIGLFVIGLALAVGSATAAPPPSWFVQVRDSGPAIGPPKDRVGVQAAQDIPGALTVEGPVCLGSTGASGCGSDYTPTAPLEVNSTSGGISSCNCPVIRMMNARPSTPPTAWWDFFPTAGSFQLSDIIHGTTPLVIGNSAPTVSLAIDPTGKVGLGLATPLAHLQVGAGTTGVATAGASILAEEGVASSMIIKSTAGPEMFLYEDQNNGLMGTASNTPFGLRSNNTNRFWMDQNGNVGIGTNFTNPAHLLQVGNSSGAFTDGTTWSNASSRSLKENFKATDDQSVLQKLVSLPIDSWNYKTDSAGIRHLGPTAEDFMATFGLGSTDKAISTVDADGVSMAAIKGLYDEVQAKDARIEALSKEVAGARADNARLQGRLDAVESRLTAIQDGSGSAGAPTGKASTPGTRSMEFGLAAVVVALTGAIALVAIRLRSRPSV